MSELLVPPPPATFPSAGQPAGPDSTNLLRRPQMYAQEMGVAVDREAPFYYQGGRALPAVWIDRAVSTRHEQLSLRAGAGRGDCMMGSLCCGSRLDVFGQCVWARHDPARPAVCRPRNSAAHGTWARTSNSRRCCPTFAASEVGHPARNRAARQRGGQQKRRHLGAYFKVPEAIAHLSTFYHLHPGDVILYGHP